MHLFYLAPANSVHSERWIRWFANGGHTITWLSAHPSIVDPIPGAVPKILPLGVRSPVRWMRWLRAVYHEVRAARPDLVHVHSLGSYALLALGVPQVVPTVLTPWGSDLATDLSHPLRRAIVRRAIHRASHFTCHSESMRDRLIRLGATPSTIHTVLFGIDASRFNEVFAKRQHTVGTATGVSRPLRIISLRNLDPIYDHPTLLRAVACLRDQRIPVTVRLYGYGPELARLQAMTEQLNLNDEISFCGKYSPAALPLILEDADVYVSAAVSDASIAVSTAEAMAAGVPVVISNAADNRCWITDGVNGRLFPSGDHRALAEILASLAHDRARLPLLATAGRQTIIERDDYALEMHKMEILYRTFLRRDR